MQMNIHVRASVQSVHLRDVHMISDGHYSIDDVPVKDKTSFALSVFAGHRCHSSLFHACFAV